MPGLNLHAIYLTVIAVLLLAAGAGAWYWHHETLIEGENKILTGDRAAVAKQAAAVEAQYELDQEDAAHATTALQTELASLRGALAAAPAAGIAHGVRCFAQRSSPMPGPTAAPGGAQPANASPGSLAGVPGGASAGPDIGPGLQLLATAGAVAATYQRACATLSLTEAQRP